MYYAIILFATALAGCASGSSPTEADSCRALTESRCLESTACTLVQNAAGGPYSCRAATDSCEEGFRQTLDSAADCEAETGCSFDPGNCYCPPDLVCVCGGGPPPQCRAS